MWQRTLFRLSRPKGPPGLRPGKAYRYTVPYRSEVAMLSLANHAKFNTNIRELFKKPLEANNIKAIPRDLGEIPRNFVVRLLSLHQPIRLVDLWEICKENEDVPIDSAKHLRLVLKIAKMQKWVYTEKNQTDNLYYYHLHKSRTHEVEEMIRQDEVLAKEKERQYEMATEKRLKDEMEKRATAIDDSIRMVEKLIADNIKQIRTFDPDYSLESTSSS